MVGVVGMYVALQLSATCEYKIPLFDRWTCEAETVSGLIKHQVTRGVRELVELGFTGHQKRVSQYNHEALSPTHESG